MVALSTSWVAQVVQIVSGFLVPRMIDQKVGAEVLGLWDLGWAMTSYFCLVQFGVAGTVGTHVARYRGANNLQALREFVSSVSIFQMAVAALVVVLSLGLSHLVPMVAGGEDVRGAEALPLTVFLLGCGVAVTMLGASFVGVVTGCDRWKEHYLVYLVTNTLSFAGMLLVLSAGYDLIALALVHLCCQAVGVLARAGLAFKHCEGLQIRLRYWSAASAKRFLNFGGKVFVFRVSFILMNGSMGLMISSFLGPAVLALFARPRSLVRQAMMFPQKFALMLTPRAAEIAAKSKESLHAFAIRSIQQGIFIVLPMIVGLVICGPLFIRLWMGDGYAVSTLMIIIACGFLAESAFQPVVAILLGVDKHGKPALFALLGAVAAVVSCAVCFSLGGSLEQAAIAALIPWSLAHGVAIPWYATRALPISWSDLFGLWLKPLACVVPLVIGLLCVVWLSNLGVFYTLLLCGLVGGGVLGLTYAFWAFPDIGRRLIRGRRVCEG